MVKYSVAYPQVVAAPAPVVYSGAPVLTKSVVHSGPVVYSGAPVLAKAVVPAPVVYSSPVVTKTVVQSGPVGIVRGAPLVAAAPALVRVARSAEPGLLAASPAVS